VLWGCDVFVTWNNLDALFGFTTMKQGNRGGRKEFLVLLEKISVKGGNCGGFHD
jgi:hypothetical protein